MTQHSSNNLTYASFHANSAQAFVIETSRLQLRPPDIRDANDLFVHTRDARITEFLAWTPHQTICETTNLIKALLSAMENDTGYHWFILVQNQIAGLISLIDVRRNHRTWRLDRAELSYWLSPDFQGSGYMTEAGYAVLNFAFNKLCLHKIILAHAEKNIASQRVALRLGFKKYGFERDAFEKNGIWQSLIWYDLLESEFFNASEKTQ